jgi:hypothetical protein
VKIREEEEVDIILGRVRNIGLREKFLFLDEWRWRLVLYK